MVRKGAMKKKTSKKSKPSLFGDQKIPVPLFKPYAIYRFHRRAPETAITQTAGAETLGALQFTLSAVNGNTEFTNLFDSYRIAFVKVSFLPVYNMQAIAVLATTTTPRLTTSIDLDDITTPASVGAINERSTSKVTKFDQIQIRHFKPRVAANVYGGAVFGNFAMAPADQWMDCASNAVSYFGLKYGITAGAGGQTLLQSWSVEFEYFLEFRYSR